MPYINKVQLMGHLGGDPEKRTAGEHVVATFSLATSRGKDDKKKTEWHNVQVWDKSADFALQYCKKGDLIFIEGQLEYQSWEDKETSEKKYRTVINAFQIMSLTKREKTASGTPPTGAYEQGGDDDVPF